MGARMGGMGQQANPKQMQFMSDMLRGKAMPGAGGAMSQRAMQAGAEGAQRGIGQQVSNSPLASLNQTQLAAMQKAQQGAPSVTPTPSMDKAYDDMQAQKSGATPAASQAAPMKKGGSVKETKKMFGGGMARAMKRGMGTISRSMGAKPAAKPAAKAAPASTPAPAAAPMKKGGVAESKKMVGKEIAFMKKKGAPKSMVKHEMAEAGMKTKKYAKGGMVAASKMGSVRTASPSRDGIASKGKTKGTMVKMAGSTKGMKRGGAC
jgi:hypothetical protein